MKFTPKPRPPRQAQISAPSLSLQLHLCVSPEGFFKRWGLGKCSQPLAPLWPIMLPSFRTPLLLPGSLCRPLSIGAVHFSEVPTVRWGLGQARIRLTTEVRSPWEWADACILAAPDDDQERKVQGSGLLFICCIPGPQLERGRSPAPKEGTS